MLGGMTIERGISTVRYLLNFFVSPKKTLRSRKGSMQNFLSMDPLRDLNVFFGDTKKFSKYLTVSHMFICFWEKQADVSDFLCKLDVHAKSIDHFWKPCLAKFKRQIEQQLQQSSGIFRSPMCRYPELFLINFLFTNFQTLLPRAGDTPVAFELGGFKNSLFSPLLGEMIQFD